MTQYNSMTNSYVRWYIHKNTEHNAVSNNEIKKQDTTQELTMWHTQKDRLWYADRMTV